MFAPHTAGLDRYCRACGQRAWLALDWRLQMVSLDRRHALGFAALVLAAFTPLAASAGEPECDYYINAAPVTITAQAHYCLSANLSYNEPTGQAILIDANSV